MILDYYNSPAHIAVYDENGDKIGETCHIITNYDDTRELFVYEIPRGLEIIGLECARFYQTPGAI